MEQQRTVVATAGLVTTALLVLQRYRRLSGGGLRLSIAAVCGILGLCLTVLRRRLRKNVDEAAGNIDFVFGFGSLLDDESRLSSMSCKCRAATLCEVRGFVRSWCFRSDTGFTAIGGFSAEATTRETPKIRGILFPAGADLQSLDKRERGYRRVQIELDWLTLKESARNCTCDCNANDGNCGASSMRKLVSFLQGETHGAKTPRVWVYLPTQEHVRPASADYPICQTYLDVVLNG